MNIVFRISGGIGKCIASTAVCKAIKKKYPESKLIVISAYPEVFINNPNLYKSLHSNNLAYFFTDYLEGKEYKLFLHDPYETTEYSQQKNLLTVWCEMFGIPYSGEMPELFLTKREIDFYQKNFSFSKPVMLLQTNGGFDHNMKYNFTRDIPFQISEGLINHFSHKYDIVHVRRDDQISFNNTIPLTGGFREVLSVALLSEKRVMIDSFLQHACAALKLPSTVLWISTKPEVFGYQMHQNIMANPYTCEPDYKNSFILKMDFSGNPAMFPYRSEDEIFDLDTIIDKIEHESL